MVVLKTSSFLLLLLSIRQCSDCREVTLIMFSTCRLLRRGHNSNIFPRLFSKQVEFKLPKRIILVRHGESVGNVNEEEYATTPDWAIPLTEKGKEQAKQLGAHIHEIIGSGMFKLTTVTKSDLSVTPDPVLIYCSPYVRSKQTLKYMMMNMEANEIVDAREEPRMAEQQFGNFQKNGIKSHKEDRSNFGRFYYCFPEGNNSEVCLFDLIFF